MGSKHKEFVGVDREPSLRCFDATIFQRVQTLQSATARSKWRRGIFYTANCSRFEAFDVSGLIPERINVSSEERR